MGALVYSNTFQSEFQFDDRDFIVINDDIKELTDIKSIFLINDRPLRFVAFLTFAVNYHFHQLDVFGYHFFNWIIHIANTFFVGMFSFLLLKANEEVSQRFNHKELFAFISALIFLVHPLQTESVAYITQRFASLAALFYLLSICAYLYARTVAKNKAPYFAAAFIFAVIGMFTKQTVFTLPFSILLIELFFLKRREDDRKYLTGLLVVLAGLAVVIPLMYSFNLDIIAKSFRSRSDATEIITFDKYFFTQFRVIPVYIKLLFVPLNQNLLYEFSLSKNFWNIKTLLGFVFLLSVLFAGVRLYKNNRMISFGIFWFFLTISVESSIIPIPHVIFEHRCYLPMVGVSIAMAAFLLSIMRSKKKLVALSVFLIGTLSVLTFQRNRVWATQQLMWQDVVRKSPTMPRASANLGVVYLEKHDYQNAIKYFSESLKTAPHLTSAAITYQNRGLAYSMTGNNDLALKDYQSALDINPEIAQVYNNRGLIYKERNQLKQALKDFNKALEINDQQANLFVNRGTVYKELGRYDLALEDFTKAIELSPGLADAYNNRGIIYRKKGNPQEAIKDYTKALELNPSFVQAYNNRAIVYKDQNKVDEAIDDYNRAINIDSRYISAYVNRANLYARLDRTEESLMDYNMAIAIDEDSVIARINRAKLFNKLGRYQEAYYDATKAQALGARGLDEFVEYLKGRR